MRLDCQISLKSLPPKLTGWIRPLDAEEQIADHILVGVSNTDPFERAHVLGVR